MSPQSPGQVPGPPIKASDFFARNPLFRVDEFLAAYLPSGRSRATAAALLRYHVNTGQLRNVRRGLYARVGPVDPWVLGSRMTHDAIVAYDGALSFHHLSGLGHRISYVSPERSSSFAYNEVVYTGVRAPRRPGDHELFERAGQALRVTSLSQTLVDLLDRLDLAPPPDALFDCFAQAPGLDFDAMIDRARHCNAMVVARLGFFLEHLDAGPRTLARLERSRPGSPGYFNRADRARENVLQRRWNLVVPLKLALHAERAPRRQSR